MVCLVGEIYGGMPHVQFCVFVSVPACMQHDLWSVFALKAPIKDVGGGQDGGTIFKQPVNISCWVARHSTVQHGADLVTLCLTGL